MDCEVLVVGAGIGGLTVAALLAKRGVDVCLMERQPNVGGCAAAFEKFGFHFEQGHGLFTGWGLGGIHEQIEAELELPSLGPQRLNPSYVVRFDHETQVNVSSDDEHFYSELRDAFPECAGAAVDFYVKVHRIGNVLHRLDSSSPETFWASKMRRAYQLLRLGGRECLALEGASTASQLDQTSDRFHRFVDAQLRIWNQGDSTQVSFLSAAFALSKTRADMFQPRGGASALTETLADSFRRSGGKLRLNSPVLRLSYDSTGAADGVDLLNGEKVHAKRAIVSNLTIWDTYGKLVGLTRTPPNIRKMLTDRRGWGAYLIYTALDAGAILPHHVLSISDGEGFQGQFMFSVTPEEDATAPNAKRPATVHFLTDVDEWFTFHQDEMESEEQDQRMLDLCWTRLHEAMPELGSQAEVIDTATPRTFYELTRRKLGMVGGTMPSNSFWLEQPPFETIFRNLFIISDTTDEFAYGFEGLSRRALLLANRLT